MITRSLRAIALRVVYHVEQKLNHLHGQPTRTLVMMITAFLAVGGPWLSRMGRTLAHLPGSLQEKVKRMSRFLCRSVFDVHEAFEAVARRLIEGVAHAHPKRMILVAMDWTDLGDFMGLWLSIPYHGRALPLMCAVLPKAGALGSMTTEEEELLRRFLGLFPAPLRSRIVILADRGFAKQELFDEILRLGAHFAIRLPRDRHILLKDGWKELRELSLDFGRTLYLRQVPCTQEHAFPCNIAIRRLPQGEAPDPQDDTWYIATDVEDIPIALGWYSQRFQIEEMYRDLKSRFHIDRHLLGTEESVAKMTLIASLSYLIVLEDGTQWRDRVALARIQKKTAWGKLSLFSIASSCFELCLTEAPTEVSDLILARWINRRAA